MDVWLGAIVITAVSWAFANTTIGIAQWLVRRRDASTRTEDDEPHDDAV